MSEGNKHATRGSFSNKPEFFQLLDAQRSLPGGFQQHGGVLGEEVVWLVKPPDTRRAGGGTRPWCLPGLGGSAEAYKGYFWVGSALLGVGANPAFCHRKAGGEHRTMEKGKRDEGPRCNAGDLPQGNTDTREGKKNSVLLETHMVYGNGHLSWRI